jgi:hypothetical protein
LARFGLFALAAQLLDSGTNCLEIISRAGSGHLVFSQ